MTYRDDEEALRAKLAEMEVRLRAAEKAPVSLVSHLRDEIKKLSNATYVVSFTLAMLLMFARFVSWCNAPSPPPPPDNCPGICASLDLPFMLRRDHVVIGYECVCTAPHRVCRFESTNGDIACQALP